MTPARVSGRLSPEEFALYEIAYRAMRAAQAPMPVVELVEATYTVDDVSPADRSPCAEQGLCEVLVTTASVLSDGWWEELPDAKESFLLALTAPDTDAGLREAAAHPDVRFVATPGCVVRSPGHSMDCCWPWLEMAWDGPPRSTACWN